ncbi:hypothetical protein K4L06_01210 [Lysobacter sp. BMK333-48F3]|uniref:hypothetical protein n=1 Tax=Lysobacter sp. BMK333-48F3 TaxID=2867962 RepID=UPI001C8B5A22|nr:hypothetical protein [Lysobacter sp. BMK333-48F3]MBX9399913.1 hypothetical protein [Lysobacter sp. BMK333-48F3]
MTPLLVRLQTYAHDRDYLPHADPADADSERMLDGFERHYPQLRAHRPGNDAYSHRLDIRFGPEARADILLRFDLRVFVVLAYRVEGALRHLAIDDDELELRCAPLLDELRRHGFKRLAFADACTSLSRRMLAHGFIDDTVLAYFFESL